MQMTFSGQKNKVWIRVNKFCQKIVYLDIYDVKDIEDLT